MFQGSEEYVRTISVSFVAATREYARHGLTEQDLINDLGDHIRYWGADVLDALGY